MTLETKLTIASWALGIITFVSMVVMMTGFFTLVWRAFR